MGEGVRLKCRVHCACRVPCRSRFWFIPVHPAERHTSAAIDDSVDFRAMGCKALSVNKSRPHRRLETLQ